MKRGSSQAARATEPRPETELGKARRSSVEMLDSGRVRPQRGALARREEVPSLGTVAEDTPLPENDDEVLEVFYSVNDENILETYHVQKNRTEVHVKDMSELELWQMEKGIIKEWKKLLDTGSIEIHLGEKARRLRETTPQRQILESRFVKTRREKPDEPGVKELKCRWCIKGYKDPEVLDVDKPLPMLYLPNGGCMWRTLQTHPEPPGPYKDPEVLDVDIPGVPPGATVEIKKHVYRLVDAPRKWWQCLRGELQKLGMKMSALDPCCYYWHIRTGFCKGFWLFMLMTVSPGCSGKPEEAFPV